MFNKTLATFAAGLALTLGLVACDKQKAAPEAAVEQAAEVVPMPTDASDTAAWKKYLAATVMANMEGVKTSRPYMYFVPGGDDEKAQDDRSNQLDNVYCVVARGVLPGNMMAFGGPDSSITADLMADAFADAQAGAFKDVLVLFIGSSADAERVKEALAKSGATFRLAEMR